MQNYTKTWILKESIAKQILDDPDLHAKVAKAINVRSVSVSKVVSSKSPKLTQYACLYAISKHLGIPQRELLTEEEVVA